VSIGIGIGLDGGDRTSSLTQEAEDRRPSLKMRLKSADDSAEGKDHRWRPDDDGRTRQWRHQSAGCEDNGLPTTTATGSGKNGWGQTTTATNASSQTMVESN
jgi:hypothetical protein